MKTRSTVFAALAGAFMLVATPPADAVTSPSQRCNAAKLNATGRLLRARLFCSARAARNGVEIEQSCETKADARLLAVFARIDGRGGCGTTGDGPETLALIDTLVGQIDLSVRPMLDANRCAAKKLHALRTRSFADLACALNGRRSRESEDQCVERIGGAFEKTLAQLERRGNCLTTDDAEALQLELTTTLLVLKRSYAPAPVGAPANLTAKVDGVDVALGWRRAAGFAHTAILRRLNTPPTDANDPDAALVYFGTGDATTDPLSGLLPDTPTVARTHHYAAFACGATRNDCAAGASRMRVTPTVVETLRAGGYVIHWRHAVAIVCSDATALGTAAKTSSPNWWKSCDASCGTATARQLSPTGIADATAIGQAFDQLAIPVGRVLSSEFCRVFATAALMDFGPTIEQRQDITFFVYDEASRCQSTQLLLAEPPDAGTNTAIVGHGPTTACGILNTLAMGEAAIFKPDGMGGTTFITRVPPNEWLWQTAVAVRTSSESYVNSVEREAR